MQDIKWKLHLKSSPQKVFEFLSTSDGRKKFWAESAEEKEGYINFSFINGQEYKSEIIKCQPHSLYEIDYFGWVLRFELADDGSGGTDLTMTNFAVSDDEYLDVYAGWLSVLFALKGAVDFNIDLRNHDKNRTWDNLFVDN